MYKNSHSDLNNCRFMTFQNDRVSRSLLMDFLISLFFLHLLDNWIKKIRKIKRNEIILDKSFIKLTFVNEDHREVILAISHRH